MSRRNRDLSLSACGNDLRKTSHHVRLIQTHHDLTLELFRNRISAVCLHSFGKNIVNKPLSSKMCTEIFLVRIGSAPGLFLHILSRRSSGKRHIDRLVELRLPCLSPLLTVDRRSQILNLLLHTAVCRIVLGGEHAVLILVGIHKVLRSLPHLCSLLDHIFDSHISIPP